LLLFRVFLHKSLLFKNVPTQSPTFVLGVPIVRQLLPNPKPVCYVSNNTYSALVSVGFVQFGGGNHVVNFNPIRTSRWQLKGKKK